MNGTLALPVDAEPGAVREALERLDLTTWIVRALQALGLTDRIAGRPARVGARPGSEFAFELIWRLDDRAQPSAAVTAVWDVRVQAAAVDGSLLSASWRFVAADADSRARLLAGWTIVDSLARALAQRTLATVRGHAENHDARAPAHAAARVARAA